MSPLIVTTKRQERSALRAAQTGGLSLREQILSRVAVATLEDAPCPFCGAQGQPCIDGSFTMPLGSDHEARKRLKAIPESGGTIGPLPDGTVIEVERTTWYVLWKDAPGVGQGALESATAGDTEAQQRILDAFNAQEAKR